MVEQEETRLPLLLLNYTATYFHPMRTLLLAAITTVIALPAKAQLIFRNSGRDTMRVAVGTFYDTSRKSIMSAGESKKPVIVTGWYWLYPGDSVVIGKFLGPAVYYRRELIRDRRYVIGDT